MVKNVSIWKAIFIAYFKVLFQHSTANWGKSWNTSRTLPLHQHAPCCNGRMRLWYLTVNHRTYRPLTRDPILSLLNSFPIITIYFSRSNFTLTCNLFLIHEWFLSLELYSQAIHTILMYAVEWPLCHLEQKSDFCLHQQQCLSTVLSHLYCLMVSENRMKIST